MKTVTFSAAGSSSREPSRKPVDLDEAVKSVKFPRIRYESPVLQAAAATQSLPIKPCTSFDEYRSLMRCNVTNRLDPQDRFARPATETQKIGWFVRKPRFGGAATLSASGGSGSENWVPRCGSPWCLPGLQAVVSPFGPCSHKFNLKVSFVPPGDVHPALKHDPPPTRTTFAVDIGAHPDRVDLRETGRLPPVYHQGKLNACTGNALAAAVHFAKPSVAPSRLFIYYNERTLEQDVANDDGADLVDGIKALHQQGVCDESLWPYTDDKVKFAAAPPEAAYKAAAMNQVTKFENILPDHDHIKAALASGLPVVLGLTLYSSFLHPDATGAVPMPKPGVDTLVGGHAVLIVGYDEATQQWIVRNSWGEGWGDGGYCRIPYAYISAAHLATNPWVVQEVEV